MMHRSSFLRLNVLGEVEFLLSLSFPFQEVSLSLSLCATGACLLEKKKFETCRKKK